jgi:GH24 family phage-related lysozyme (muramidase)
MPIGMRISLDSINMIINFEVSSESYYNKSCKNPTWPQGDSGITIGIGYDLGYNSKEDIQSDWKNKLSPAVIKKLQSVSGEKGQKAKALLKTVADIEVPFIIAKSLFIEKSIPKFAKLTKQSFPGVDSLNADTQGVLLSLVYNRGGDTKNTDSRKEMHNIVPLVLKKDYKGIAAQLRSMKRLWKLNGLLLRREAEAKMVENSNHEYKQSEIINL